MQQAYIDCAIGLGAGIGFALGCIFWFIVFSATRR